MPLRDDEGRDRDGDSWNRKEKASSMYCVEVVKNNTVVDWTGRRGRSLGSLKL